jgi:septum formation protein
VVGAVCLIDGDRTRTAVTTTHVVFRSLDQPLIDWYLGTGEWHDRAGAYAIQGKGAALVARIEGDYLNIVGLPVAALLQLEPRLLG